MEQALALQVKAEHDCISCRAAVAEAEQQLQHTRQEAAKAAEAAWRRQVADHEAAVRIEQESYQAEQVTHHESSTVSLETAVWESVMTHCMPCSLALCQCDSYCMSRCLDHFADWCGALP